LQKHKFTDDGALLQALTHSVSTHLQLLLFTNILNALTHIVKHNFKYTAYIYIYIDLVWRQRERGEGRK